MPSPLEQNTVGRSSWRRLAHWLHALPFITEHVGTVVSAVAARMLEQGTLKELDFSNHKASAAFGHVAGAFSQREKEAGEEEKRKQAQRLQLGSSSGGVTAQGAQDAAGLTRGAVAAVAPPPPPPDGLPYAGWEYADPVFASICVCVWLGALLLARVRTRRASVGIFANSLGASLPPWASFLLSITILLNLGGLAYVRTMPWPQMRAVVSIAGDSWPPFVAYTFPNIGQFASKFWSEGQWGFAVALWLSCGLWLYLRLCLTLLTLHAPPLLLSPRRRRMLLEACNFGAKWTKVYRYR